METWLHDEILDGLSKLLCLSLDRTPASDLIAGTAMTWCEALADMDWDQTRDTPRIRGAFATLARTREQWPAPRHFRDVLPPSKQLRLAGEGERPFDPPELVATMQSLKPEEVITSIGDAARAIAPKVEVVTPEQREAAERELAAMRDRKSQAAGADA